MIGSLKLRVSLVLLLLGLNRSAHAQGNLAKLRASLHIIGAIRFSIGYHFGHVEGDMIWSSLRS